MTPVARRRRNLHAQNPCCHWCSVTTFLPQTKADLDNPRCATLDHLFERSFGKRDMSVVTPGSRTVLACIKCNLRRGDEHGRKLNASLSLERTRLRSQTGHHIKRSFSWLRFLRYEPLELGTIMDAGNLT